jgi:hypothetical protein
VASLKWTLRLLAKLRSEHALIIMILDELYGGHTQSKCNIITGMLVDRNSVDVCRNLMVKQSFGQEAVRYGVYIFSLMTQYKSSEILRS